MKLVPPWQPQGRALEDAWSGETRGPLRVHAEAGDVEEVDPQHFLRGPDAFEAWERAALDAAVGRVLDVGAGGGSHAVELQRRGLQVSACDVDERAVRVLRARGVRDAWLGSLLEAPEAGADTLLMLMHGVGLAGDEQGLIALLDEAARALAPGGRLLLDGRGPGDESRVASSRLQLEYAGELGAPFDWLWPDWEVLQELASSEGWTVERLGAHDEPRWLARLTRVTDR